MQQPHDRPAVSLGQARATMFFQMAAMGAVSPIISLYLQQTLHFSGFQTGVTLALAVPAALLGPLLASRIVDRKLAAPVLLVICNLGSILATLVLMLAHDFPLFLTAFLLQQFCVGPTTGLLNTLAFRSLGARREAFGAVRLWGTAGWIVTGWVYSLVHWLAPSLPWLFMLAVASSLVVLVVALGMDRQRFPPPPEPAGSRFRIFPPTALAVLRQPGLRVAIALYVCCAFMDRIFYFGAGPYLTALGVSADLAPSVLTLGQITEVVALALLQPVLTRFGYRRLVFLGLAAQTLRLLAFLPGITALSIAVLLLHGLVFAWVFSLCTLTIDHACDDRSRGAVHQVVILLFGAGGFLGNLAAGALADLWHTNAPGVGPQQWALFWLVPAGLSCLVFLLLRGYRPPATALQPGALPPVLPDREDP